jgi:hypothetical protein
VECRRCHGTGEEPADPGFEVNIVMPDWDHEKVKARIAEALRKRGTGWM